jgi:hypothetical protein
MSLLSRLFGGGGGAAKPAPEPEPEPEVHNGFRIYPEPSKAPGGYRVEGRIEKDVDGATRSHHLIRADILDSEDAAHAHTLRKAQQLIDQMGEKLFDS